MPLRSGKAILRDGLAEPCERTPRGELVQPQHVAEVVVAADVDRRSVDPLFRIAHHDVHLVELLDRIGARRGSEPLVLLEALAELRAHVAHDFLGILATLRREIARDVELPERVTEATADRLRDHELALGNVGLPGQRAGQVRLHGDELRGEVRAGEPQRLPLQVRLRVLERILPEHRVPFPDRPDVGDQHVPARRQPEIGEERVEVRVRESGLQLGVRHALHGGADVALLHRRQLLARDARLHLEHLGCAHLGLGGRYACQRE
jgi:hypothetical protein